MLAFGSSAFMIVKGEKRSERPLATIVMVSLVVCLVTAAVVKDHSELEEIASYPMFFFCCSVSDSVISHLYIQRQA